MQTNASLGRMRFSAKALRSMITCIVLASVAYAGDAPTPDRDLIHGKWRVVEGSSDGKAIPKEMLEKQSMLVEFVGNRMMMSNDQEHRTFDLAPEAKPKQIDIVDADEKPDRRTMVGIYEFLGKDRLRICTYIGDPPNVRPEDFDSAGHRNSMVMVRVK